MCCPEERCFALTAPYERVARCTGRLHGMVFFSMAPLQRQVLLMSCRAATWPGLYGHTSGSLPCGQIHCPCCTGKSTVFRKNQDLHRNSCVTAVRCAPAFFFACLTPALARFCEGPAFWWTEERLSRKGSASRPCTLLPACALASAGILMHARCLREGCPSGSFACTFPLLPERVSSCCTCTFSPSFPPSLTPP